jgi:alpha-beta hydrolase superfamily lysophospholipase
MTMPATTRSSSSNAPSVPPPTRRTPRSTPTAPGGSVSADRIVDVDVPVALIQAGDDIMVPPAEGRELERIAHAAGVPDVRHEVVAGANHVFRGCEQEAIARCGAWLDEVIL